MFKKLLVLSILVCLSSSSLTEDKTSAEIASKNHQLLQASRNGDLDPIAEPTHP